MQGFRDLIGREPDVDGGPGAGGRGGAVDQPRPRSGDQDGLQDLLGLLWCALNSQLLMDLNMNLTELGICE